MLDKKKLNKIFQTVVQVKKLNRAQQEIEEKVLLSQKNLIIPAQPLKKSKKVHKNLFAPMNSFITTTTNTQNLSKLYKFKLLPSQYLSTSKNIISRLTKKIYNSPKQATFPLKLPETCISKPGIIKNRVTISHKELSGDSYSKLNETCDDFLKQNEKSRKFLKNKSKLLNKKYLAAKRMVNSVEQSNNRAGYYLFHNKLSEGHSHLLKLDLIHSKKHKPEVTLNL